MIKKQVHGGTVLIRASPNLLRRLVIGKPLTSQSLHTYIASLLSGQPCCGARHIDRPEASRHERLVAYAAALCRAYRRSPRLVRRPVKPLLMYFISPKESKPHNSNELILVWVEKGTYDLADLLPSRWAPTESDCEIMN